MADPEKHYYTASCAIRSLETEKPFDEKIEPNCVKMVGYTYKGDLSSDYIRFHSEMLNTVGIKEGIYSIIRDDKTKIFLLKVKYFSPRELTKTEIKELERFAAIDMGDGVGEAVRDEIEDSIGIFPDFATDAVVVSKN